MLIAGTIVTAVKVFEDGSLSILCQCRSWASILVNVEIKGGQSPREDQEYRPCRRNDCVHEADLYSDF